MSEPLPMGQAAQQSGVPLHVFVSWLCRSGALLVIPGSEDERCVLVAGDEFHVAGCGCGFVPVHPEITELGN